ncbi:MAG: hypothetical protein Q8O76_06225 [Chloroflexota bacterium]|nr:hypothetical protein [Chloroflexota bacterium]
MTRPKFIFAVVTWVDPVRCCYGDVITLRGNAWYYLYEEPPGSSLLDDLYRLNPIEFKRRLKSIEHQAFSTGQLIVLDANIEREVGCGSKPGKWGSLDDGTPIRRSEMMRYKLFTNLEDAVAEVERIKDVVKPAIGDADA